MWARPRAAARVEKPQKAMVPTNSRPLARKYRPTGWKSRSCTRTPAMVRNSSAGVSTRNTMFDRSLMAAARTQPMRAAPKPTPMPSSTGMREEKTGEFKGGSGRKAKPAAQAWRTGGRLSAAPGHRREPEARSTPCPCRRMQSTSVSTQRGLWRPAGNGRCGRAGMASPPVFHIRSPPSRPPSGCGPAGAPSGRPWSSGWRWGCRPACR